MASQTLSFTIKLKIPGTTDLTPPGLAAECNIEMDTDEDHERALWAYYKKHFEKQLKKKLEAQIKNFDTPLKSMQKDLDVIKNDYKKLTNAKTMEALAAQCKSSSAIAKAVELKKEVGKLEEYLAGAVQNIEKQQLLVWKTAFEKEAKAAALKKIKSDIRWKKFRTTIGVVLVGVLVVGGAALGIAASIASFGAVPAAIAIIGVSSASIGGLSALVQTGRSIKSNLDLEKASIAKVSADLDEIAVHLGKTSSKITGLPKHLDDASRFHSLRRESLKKAEAKIASIDRDIAKLRGGLSDVSAVQGTSATSDIEKKIKVLEQNKAGASDIVKKCLKRDEELIAVFARARNLVGDLQKIDFTGPRTISDSLGRYKNVDTVLNAVNMVNSVGNNANTLAGALP